MNCRSHSSENCTKTSNLINEMIIFKSFSFRIYVTHDNLILVYSFEVQQQFLIFSWFTTDSMLSEEEFYGFQSTEFPYFILLPRKFASNVLDGIDMYHLHCLKKTYGFV